MRAWRDGCEAAGVTSMHLVCSAWFGSVLRDTVRRMAVEMNFSASAPYFCVSEMDFITIESHFSASEMDFFGSETHREDSEM